MIIATLCFFDVQSACDHFKPFMFKNTTEVVASKVRSGNVTIGKPMMRYGEKIVLDVSEGRYYIHTKD